VDLKLGDARALSFASESFDTVVEMLVLCALEHQSDPVEAKRLLALAQQDV
jgi:hypothetical protein